MWGCACIMVRLQTQACVLALRRDEMRGLLLSWLPDDLSHAVLLDAGSGPSVVAVAVAAAHAVVISGGAGGVAALTDALGLVTALRDVAGRSGSESAAAAAVLALLPVHVPPHHA